MIKISPILTEATPDEIRSGGAGLKIRWGISESPFGNMFLAESQRGLTHLSFFDRDEKESLDVMKKDWPKAEWQREERFAGEIAKNIITNIGTTEFRLHVKGTPFQAKVWQALLNIKPGEVSTYGRIASKMGLPGASRAVGSAVGANRISWLIPCHRVIRTDGGLGGFRWGTERKRAMLERENAVLSLI